MMTTASAERCVPALGDTEERWVLRLYVAGQSPRSLAALRNLKDLCEAYLARRYAIEVVDLLESPGRAKEHGIVAIPTLVRLRPCPVRKVVGDLSDPVHALGGLDLRARPGR